MSDLKEIKAAAWEAVEPLKTGIDKLDQQNKALADAVKGLDDKDKGIEERLKAVESAALARKAPVIAGLEDELANRRKRTGVGFSLARLATAQLMRRDKIAAFELDVVRFYAKEIGYAAHKDMSTDVDTAGGFIVPTQAIPEVIELLRAKSILKRLGATMLDGLTGSPVEIPVQTGAVSASWVGENSDGSFGDASLGQRTMQVRKLMSLCAQSAELVKMAVPSVDRLIRNDIAISMDLAVDLAGLKGTGSAHQPKGIMNTTGVNTASLASVTMDKLQNALLEAEKDNVDLTAYGWAFNPVGWNKVRQLKDLNGQYFLRPDTSASESKQLLAGKVEGTTQLSDGDCILGNFSDLLIGEWGGLEFAASMEAGEAFKKYQVWIRATLLTDIIVRHPESFVVVTDLS